MADRQTDLGHTDKLTADTDKLADTQTSWQTHRQFGSRHKDKLADTQTIWQQTHRQAGNRHIEKLATDTQTQLAAVSRETNWKQTDREVGSRQARSQQRSWQKTYKLTTNRHAYRQTSWQQTDKLATDRQAGRQTDKLADRQTDKLRHFMCSYRSPGQT